MKKNNLITVLKLWLITALELVGWANADRFQGNCRSVQSLFPQSLRILYATLKDMEWK